MVRYIAFNSVVPEIPARVFEDLTEAQNYATPIGGANRIVSTHGCGWISGAYADRPRQWFATSDAAALSEISPRVNLTRAWQSALRLAASDSR